MPAKKKYTLGQASDLHDLTLPSGATCQARRPGVQGLISAGILDNFDELTSIVKTDHLDTKSVRPKGSVAGTPKVTDEEAEAAIEVLKTDPGKLGVAFELVDKLTAFVVTQPPVWVDYQLSTEDGDQFAKRVVEAEAAEAIPVRAIDLDDKMFLLNWAIGGVSDLKSFRT